MGAGPVAVHRIIEHNHFHFLVDMGAGPVIVSQKVRFPSSFSQFHFRIGEMASPKEMSKFFLYFFFLKKGNFLGYSEIREYGLRVSFFKTPDDAR